MKFTLGMLVGTFATVLALAFQAAFVTMHVASQVG